MPIKMCEILRDYKLHYDSEKVRLAEYLKETDRLFTQIDGKDITPQTMRFWLSKFLEENNKRKVSPHSLRHTNATLQLRNGISSKVVAHFLGHENAAVTLSIYTHFLQEDEDTSANFFDDLFTKKEQPKEPEPPKQENNIYIMKKAANY